ncbi:MAG: helicase-related protein, partial [Bacteriovoracaceae bacterium]
KGVVTNLLTGEEVIELPDATHYSSTIEMARMNEEFDCVVIDEIQMITDTQRGWAWTRALVNINSDEVHVCGDHSVLELVEKILELTGDELEIRKYERMTKLEVMKSQLKLTELEKHDALIVFSRRNALKYKMDLEKLGFKVSIVYGRLSPEVRREQARKFDQGETDIMVSTDAIAMGMNLPIKRIIFSTLSKFFNSKEHPITESEIKQIAGRAGRFKRFPEGQAGALKKVDEGLDLVRSALNTELEQKELAMVGPDLEIFRSVNKALEENSLATLSLSEFLRLFNTMIFEKPFFCVDLKEMIEVTEMVEGVDEEAKLSDSEVFGFACAPVNLGLLEHVQYFIWMANHYVKDQEIVNEDIDAESDDIDYLERAIKCVELYQWLARHFDNQNFSFSERQLLANKTEAIEKLNELLSQKISPRCSSCGVKLPESFEFNICEACFGAKRFNRPRRRPDQKGGDGGARKGKGRGKPSYDKGGRPADQKAGSSQGSKSKKRRGGKKKRGGGSKASPFTKG